MIHLIGNPDTGLFEVVCVSRNRNYLLGSRQGYERKAGCYKCIRAMMKDCFNNVANGIWILVQDDTKEISTVWEITAKTKVLMPNIKPKKRYIPNKK